jgi:hypothetical protein
MQTLSNNGVSAAFSIAAVRSTETEFAAAGAASAVVVAHEVSNVALIASVLVVAPDESALRRTKKIITYIHIKSNEQKSKRTIGQTNNKYAGTYARVNISLPTD